MKFGFIRFSKLMREFVMGKMRSVLARLLDIVAPIFCFYCFYLGFKNWPRPGNILPPLRDNAEFKFVMYSLPVLIACGIWSCYLAGRIFPRWGIEMLELRDKHPNKWFAKVALYAILFWIIVYIMNKLASR